MSLASISQNAFLPELGTSAAAGVTSPLAGAAIATMTTPTAGLYRAHVYTKTTGTDEPLDHNMEIRAGTTVLAGKLQSTTQRGGYRSIGRPFALDGSTSVTVNATANATTGAIYHARIILVRVA